MGIENKELGIKNFKDLTTAMPVQEITQLGDPILWQNCREIGDVLAPETQPIITDLRDTLEDFRLRNGFGRGIAAPQIGIAERIIYVNMRKARFAENEKNEDLSAFQGAMINPVIVQASEETFELWDDCFSFPDLLVKVRRAWHIRVKYYDEQGVKRFVDARDDFSELLQHEIDHVHGILSIDRAVSHHAFATRKQWQRLYATPANTTTA